MDTSYMSPAGLREGYELSEQENSNLRRHLLWAAQFLNPEQRKELGKRISNKTIAEGGVIVDSYEEEAAEMKTFYNKVDRICDSLETVVNTRKMPSNTYRISMTINEIREMLPKRHQPTLNDLRVK